MKRTAKDMHCLEMLLDTCRLINRISPAGFTCISLATFARRLSAPVPRSSGTHEKNYKLFVTRDERSFSTRNII